MPHTWRFEDGRFVLRGRGPLTEAEFGALAEDLARRQAAHGRGLRSTTGLAETVARRDRRVVEKLAEVFGQVRSAREERLLREVLRAVKLGRLAQSAERRARAAQTVAPPAAGRPAPAGRGTRGDGP